jgi:hypothetical protein
MSGYFFGFDMRAPQGSFRQVQQGSPHKSADVTARESVRAAIDRWYISCQSDTNRIVTLFFPSPAAATGLQLCPSQDRFLIVHFVNPFAFLYFNFTPRWLPAYDFFRCPDSSQLPDYGVANCFRFARSNMLSALAGFSANLDLPCCFLDTVLVPTGASY